MIKKNVSYNMFRNIIHVVLIALIALSSCKNDRRFQVDISKVDIPVRVSRFDQALNALDTTQLEKEIPGLQAKYPNYYELYCRQIIHIGPSSDPHHAHYLMRFLSDSLYQEVYDTVQHNYASVEPYATHIINGLKRYHVLFPNKALPQLYFHISGFNESVVVAQDVLSISLENYLGKKHPFYEWLGVYEYKKAQKISERICPDALLGWISTEFLSDPNHQGLIDQMVYQGKLVYLMEHILPDTPQHLLLGQTKEQFAWCKSYEASVWTSMIEWKHLFSKDHLIIKKHIDDAPFNTYFGEGSAPRSAVYIGWQIVRAYMNKHPETSLQELFEMNNGQAMLQASAYRP